jgi:hypothetical protein
VTALRQTALKCHRPGNFCVAIRLNPHSPHDVAGKAERTDIETVISDLLAGQFSDPIEVLAFNTIEHWRDDLSKFVAEEICCRCDIEGQDVPAYLQEFVSRASCVNKASKPEGPRT